MVGWVSEGTEWWLCQEGAAQVSYNAASLLVTPWGGGRQCLVECGDWALARSDLVVMGEALKSCPFDLSHISY